MKKDNMQVYYSILPLILKFLSSYCSIKQKVTKIIPTKVKT